MENMKRKRDLYGVMAGLSLVFSLGISVFMVMNFVLQKWIFLGGIILLTGSLVSLWLRENYKFKIAKLIEENKILKISPAVISEKTGKGMNTKTSKGIEVLVSYFGIVLDTKIIKFNQEHIQLQTVELQKDFISLTYGTDQWIQNIRLICSILDKEELTKLSEKFEYETGIKPTILP